MTALPVNSFMDGTSGSTLNTGGNGIPGLGTSSGLLFDATTVNAGSSLNYDTTHFYSGTQSCLISTTSAVTCYGTWVSSGSMTQAAQRWFRLYLYMTANPSSVHQLYVALVSGVRCADVIINANGTLSMRNTSGTTVITTTNTVNLNAWYRIEGYVISNASTGQVELKLFNSPASATPTETQTSAANLNTLGGQINNIRYGLGTGNVANVSWWMDDVADAIAGYIGPGAVLSNMVVGGQWPNGFSVNSKAVGATSLRLKVATDSGLTQNVQFAGAQTPDTYGYVQHQVTGLSPYTRYYCGLYDTPAGGTEAAVSASVIQPLVGTVKTLPVQGQPANFSMAIASCINTSLAVANADAATTDWVNWAADLNVFTGDFNYEDPTSTSLITQIATFEDQILNFGGEQATMLNQAWGYYNRSNHDSYQLDPSENTDSDNAATTVNIQAAQEVFPFGTLADARSPKAGLYQSWVTGRIRFIQIDIRNTDRSGQNATDNSSKTMLGATQLAWFYSELIQPEPLKIVIADTAWMGLLAGATGDEEDAKWWSYSTERAAVMSFLAANQAQVQNMVFIHGDTHGVGVATGTQNTWGGFPVYCAAPMRQTGAAAYNTSTFSSFYNNSGGDCRFYGRVTVTDDGHLIQVNFQGWDAVNQVAQVSQTDTFTCPQYRQATGGNLMVGE